MKLCNSFPAGLPAEDSVREGDRARQQRPREGGLRQRRWTQVLVTLVSRALFPAPIQSA